MVKLEYFEQSDAQQLIDWIDSKRLMMNWSGSLFSFPLTLQSVAWYIEDVNDIATSEAFVYKAVDDITGKVVGHISLGGISQKNKAGRISRVFVSKENEGKGYCKQMVEAVLKVGFDDLNLHRIALGVYSFNTGAIKCYQNAGMHIEGVNRDVLQFENEWWSLVEMSMLQNEWNDKSKLI